MCLIWRERRKENWSDLGVFYPGPLKKISPNREKMGAKRWDYHFGKIWPHVLAFFFWLVSVFFIFFPPPPPPFFYFIPCATSYRFCLFHSGQNCPLGNNLSSSFFLFIYMLWVFFSSFYFLSFVLIFCTFFFK